MGYFTQEDHNWFKRVQENKDKYIIMIDNDEVWVDTVTKSKEDLPICVYTFSLYGYEFIHGLLNDLGINADFC